MAATPGRCRTTRVSGVSAQDGRCPKAFAHEEMTSGYDLEEELGDIGRTRPHAGDPEQLSRGEYVYPDYPMQVLLGPSCVTFQPNGDLRRRIANYLKQIIGGRSDQILANIPRTITTWSKLRIREGGDRIETSESFKRFRDSRRDNTFIRYEIQYDVGGANDPLLAIQYGQLERILVCQLGDEGVWRHYSHSTHILALIIPVKTEGQDASTTTTYFSKFLAPIITDIRNVKAVVGRVETRNRWGIVDRSVGLAKTTFVPDELDQHDDDDPEV
ncbi:hypothetical protein EV363DRAFT_1585187 [Boletus edulis]|nr:hypothetical protein EV363DRAFT_1585187 [Boletus edulis]